MPNLKKLVSNNNTSISNLSNSSHVSQLSQLGKIQWWLKLNSLSFLGNTLKYKLIQKFQCPKKIFEAPKNELTEVDGWTPQKLNKFLAIANNPNSIPIPNLQILEQHNIKIISIFDSNYPPLLKEIPDPPLLLFVKGKLSLDTTKPTIAIVGTRKPSQLGLEITRALAYDLACVGFTVVSGLALGIDTYAHLGTLDHPNGYTIAVIASSHDNVYPTSNRKLYNLISSKCAVVSEYAINTPAKPWHFPIRNRIISGMCDGVIVVEASIKSGSLITAKYAVDQNRDVFAIPGPVNSSLSEGTLSLIKDGAILITEASDVISFYKNKYPLLSQSQPKNSTSTLNLNNKSNLINHLSDSEVKILKILSSNIPTSLEKLLTCKNIINDNIFTVLLSLEMKNLIVKFPGNYYKSKINIP